ncbi:MAG: M17 family peptidase N-terminal domain-containing protein, partial [Polyangia bacterium]
MKFSFYTDDVTKLSCGLLGILVFEEQVGEGAIFKAVDQRLDGLLARLVADEQFKGKKGQTLSLHTHGRVAPQRVLLVGGGARKDLQSADLRGFAARVVKAGAATQATEVGAVLPYLDGGASPTT